MLRKPEIVQAVGKKSGFTQADTALVLDAYHELIEEELTAGREFKLGEIGTFRPKTNKARQCRNPHDGSMIDVPEKHKTVFKVKPSMAGAIHEALR